MFPAAADCGATALALLEKAKAHARPFPLMLLDTQMPDLNGFAIAGQMQKTARFPESAVIMLVSVGLRVDSAECREVGVHPIRPSPSNNLILLTRSRRYLKRTGARLNRVFWQPRALFPKTAQAWQRGRQGAPSGGGNGRLVAKPLQLKKPAPAKC
jgi:DNA-binding response OmpR family regulator